LHKNFKIAEKLKNCRKTQKLHKNFKIAEKLKNCRKTQKLQKIIKIAQKLQNCSKNSKPPPPPPPQIQIHHPPQIVEIVEKVVGEVSDKIENVYFNNSISLGIHRREMLVQKKIQIRSKIHNSRKLLVEGFVNREVAIQRTPRSSYTNGNTPMHHSPRTSQV